MSTEPSKARPVADQGEHWASLGERGVHWGPALLASIYRVCGRGLCLVVMAPVVTYFYAAGAAQRRASHDYLQRVWRANAWAGRPGHWQSLKHFFSFSAGLLDRFATWVGDLNRADIAEIDGGAFDAMRSDPRGALLISAHVGNTDIVRAIASRDERRPVNVIIHTAQARNFNKMIERFAPHSAVRLIPAAEIGVGTAVFLSAAIERGEWVVIMGDRSPVRGKGRSIAINFLGAPAELPLGPFFLARALKCPNYFLACYRVRDGYRARLSALPDMLSLPAPQPEAFIQILVEKYVMLLEDIVRDAPYQWFNFYDFWTRRPLETAAEKHGKRGQGGGHH